MRYLQPERIQGAQYSVKSDVWSLGITLIELALGRFPFADNSNSDSCSDYSAEDGTLSPRRPSESLLSTLTLTDPPSRNALPASSRSKSSKSSKKGVSIGGSANQMSILDLLQHIVNEPAPKLPEGVFGREADDFVMRCVGKDPVARPSPKELLVSPQCHHAVDVC